MIIDPTSSGTTSGDGTQCVNGVGKTCARVEEAADGAGGGGTVREIFKKRKEKQGLVLDQKRFLFAMKRPSELHIESNIAFCSKSCLRTV